CASAAASFSAAARNSATSCPSRAKRTSASANLSSAPAFIAVADVIAEPIASAFARNTDGSFFPNAQRITPATMAKLIHLKSSVACSVAPLPSSAADPANAHNNNTPHTLIAIKASRRQFIAPHSEKRLPSLAWQSQQPVAARRFRARASQL